MSFSPLFTRANALTAFIAALAVLPTQAAFAETLTFDVSDGGYSFDYPAGFEVDHESADGTGDVTGVTASSMTNGDVAIVFNGPWEPDDLPNVSEKTRQAIVDQFTTGIAVTPKITFDASAMTTMFGQPAVDMNFINKTGALQENPAINRFVFTILDGSAYNFRCVYRQDKAAEFAPACDLAVSTVKLRQ